MNCPKCGAQIADNATICGFCGQIISQAPADQQSNQAGPDLKPQKKENVLMGVVGAVVGALIGALAIFLFLKIEMVAAISGLVLAFCTLKGYELLGGKLSTMGIIISIVIMLITPYLAYNTYLATEIMDMFGMGFADAYEMVDQLKDASGYTEDLTQIYIFTVIGGAASVWTTIKNKKK